MTVLSVHSSRRHLLQEFAALARPRPRVRITLDNAVAEPTIAHWHGLTVDTPNDGNGSFLVAPGEA
jgi:suppressor of ftsI/bilirubin oxidase